MNKRKISLLVFAKSIDGGTGSLAVSLQRLQEKGITIHNLILEKPSYRETHTKADYLHPKKYYPYNYSFTPSLVSNFIKELTWFRGQVKRTSPDVIISLDLHCNLIASLSKLLFSKNKRFILTTNINLKATIEEKSSEILSNVSKYGIRYFYQTADSLVFPSNEMKNSILKEFQIKKKGVVIPYGASLAIEKPRAKEKKDLVVMSVGRLVEQKDFTTLIHAFEKTAQRVSNCRLVIIGEGPMRKELEALIRKKKLSRKIKMVGWKNNSSSWVAKSDIFVLSSKREGFPYVMLDALAQGRPVISTNAPFGPKEILQGGKYGVLVPVGDADRLAAAMESLLTNNTLRARYGRLSKERSRYFSEDKMLEGYLSLIRSIS